MNNPTPEQLQDAIEANETISRNTALPLKMVTRQEFEDMYPIAKETADE